jgi:hypothetical protein
VPEEAAVVPAEEVLAPEQEGVEGRVALVTAAAAEQLAVPMVR